MPNKIYTLLFLFLSLSFYSIGQTVIWSEDFENYSDNYSQNGNDNRLPSGSDWSRNVTSSNYFRVESSRVISGNKSYVGRNVNAYWLSENIDISSYTNIFASVDYLENGPHENADFIKIEYSLDGGTWTTFTNGYHQNNMSGAETATISGLNGSSLQLRITCKNSANNEYWIFDNILISGTNPNPPDCNWSLCIHDFYWSNWNPSNIKVFLNGIQYGSTLYNSNMLCIDIPISEGDDLYIDYSQGQWSSDNEYYLYDSYGNLVHSSGTNQTIPLDYTFNGLDCDPHAIEPTDQDCLGAIPICGDSYFTENSYSGEGNIPNEINPGISCLNSGEKNDVWYVFTVQQDGDLMFTISPNDLNDDYDWAVFNLTNSNCSDIASDPTLAVSCNYSGTRGVTGPDGSTGSHNQGGGGSPFNAAIHVLQNEVYVINISNYSSSQSGYFIDFSMASGVIVDVTPPELQTIVDSPTCGEDDITAWFTELVDTSSVNAGDFIVTGPGGPYAITDVIGTSNSANEREFKLSLDAQLTAGGSYSLVFSGQVNDACGNTVIGNSLGFTVAGLSGSTTVNDGTVLCYDDAVGSITASAINGSGNYFYEWSNGSTSNTISGLTAGDYTVTINDDVGVCQDVVTATINASNPYAATGVWAGTKNSNWNDCENWGGGRIPNASHDVTIPNGCANYPVFASNTTFNNSICQSIRIQNGGSFSVNNSKNLTLSSINVRIDLGGALNIEGDLIINSGTNLLVSGGSINTDGEFRNLSNTTMLDGQISAKDDFINNSNFTQTNGSIVLDKDFRNNGTYSASGGEVIFSGSGIQQIAGSNTSSFYDLTINNSSGVLLITDMWVNGELALTDGDLNISDKEVDFGTTGSLINENSTNKIVTLDGLGFPVEGGTLKATRNNPSGNIAGLGLTINPSSPLGNTVITRGPDITQGTGTFTGNSSVSRYYIIESDNRASISTDVTMSYFDSDLVSHVDGTLIMFQEVQYGLGPVYLKPLSTINNAGANTAVATTVANNLSNIKLTLGSSAQPLPVSLIDYKVNCTDEGVLIEWETASETNNNYFTIEKSSDGIKYEEIEQVDGHGNSNIALKYQTLDRFSNDEKTYYRLKQTDFDGRFEYVGIEVVDCSENSNSISFVKIHPNPAQKGNTIYINIEELDEETAVKLSIINMISQTVFEDFITTDSKGQLILKSSISKSLAKGAYILNGTYNNQSFQKKLIID